MLLALKHRGPDGEGLFTYKGLGMGMRRLAILDVAHGHQPYRSEDGRVIAVFNGEIYNFRELAEKLVAHGHRLASRADGEVIVHLYEEYGPQFVQEIKGMFAIAVYDLRTETLFLARDHIGQKPLYVLEIDDTFAFASEMKAFMAIDGYLPEVNYDLLPTYLGHRFVTGPETLLRHVTKLMPGEQMTVTHHGRKRVVTRKTYWRPLLEEPDRFGDLQAWTEQLDVLLTEVVASHLVADVSVGVFLSGGIDSSILTALTTKLSPQPLEAWSAHFSEGFPGYNESSWANTVAEWCHAPLHRVDVGPLITPERLRELAYVLDEPLGDPTVLPLDGIARAASRHHRVMLSGEGADEIFAGYAGYGEVESLARLRFLPQGLRNWWIRANLRGSGALRRSIEPISVRYRGVGFTFSGEEQARLLNPAIRASDRSPAVQQYFNDQGHLSDLQSMQGFDLRWFLPDDVLLKADRIGMHHGLEIRVPYCDPEVVELALKIPLALRRYRKDNKRVLRGVGEKYLPNKVVYRPKQGFPTPLSYLMRGVLYDLVYDTLTSANFRHSGLFHPQQVDTLLAQLQTPSESASRKVYALLMFQLWVEEFVHQGRQRLMNDSISATSFTGLEDLTF